MENTNNKNRKKSKRRKNLKKRYSIVLAILAVLILMIIGGIILTQKPDKDSGKQTNTAANTESPSNENTDAQDEPEKVSDIKAQPVDETNLENLISNAKGIQTTGYTQDSINVLNSAINDAETLLKTDFSQNEVEDACKKIIDAIQGLKK